MIQPLTEGAEPAKLGPSRPLAHNDPTGAKGTDFRQKVARRLQEKSRHKPSAQAHRANGKHPPDKTRRRPAGRHSTSAMTAPAMVAAATMAPSRVENAAVGKRRPPTGVEGVTKASRKLPTPTSSHPSTKNSTDGKKSKSTPGTAPVQAKPRSLAEVIRRGRGKTGTGELPHSAPAHRPAVVKAKRTQAVGTAARLKKAVRHKALATTPRAPLTTLSRLAPRTASLPRSNRAGPIGNGPKHSPPHRIAAKLPTWKIQPVARNGAGTPGGKAQASQWVVRPPTGPPFNVNIQQSSQTMTATIHLSAAHQAMAAPFVQHLPELNQRLTEQNGMFAQVSVLMQNGSGHFGHPSQGQPAWTWEPPADVAFSRFSFGPTDTSRIQSVSDLDIRV